jgi:hypothetical protein
VVELEVREALEDGVVARQLEEMHLARCERRANVPD